MQVKFYGSGSSMYPTLKQGDVLEVVPAHILSVGDVVVFPSVEGKRYIAHRVVSISCLGVKTRGDNLKNDDARLLQTSEVTGLVVSAHRGNKILPIRGGREGLRYATILWAIYPVRNGLVKIAGFIYRGLSDSAIFRRLNPFRFSTKVVMYRRTDGFEMQLLWGKRVIGRRMPGETEWQLRRPFRLFVDASSLPE
jgi:hypothetical protein